VSGSAKACRRSEIGRFADDIVLDDLAADDNQTGGDADA